MANLKSFVSFVSVAALASSLAACVIENDGPRRYRDDTVIGTPPATSTSSSSSTGGTADPGFTSTTPMLVELDTNQTMNAQPGEGVGVFVEYESGGHWHVWWTCDTLQTTQSCDFSVSITAGTGEISNIDASGLSGGFYSSPTASRLEARSNVSTGTEGLWFSTDAGAIITLEASLGDIKDGSFLFFVQDGKVNGGFAGQLTNPLRLQGNTP